MNLSENQFEVIEAYLANELSPTDRASFETDLAQNPDLRAEVDHQRELRLGLRALGIEQALERAKAQYVAMTDSTQEPVITGNRTPTATRWPERVPDNQTMVKPLINWRYWAAAASIVAVLGVSYYAYQQTNSRTDLAYADTFSADQSEQLMKDFPSGNVSPATRTAYLDALATYKAGKYDEVIGKLKTLPADKQTIHYKNYFLGLTYLANKQPTDAIPLLSKAQDSPNAQLRQKAEWFLALAYVKNGQNEKARPILNQISTNRANPFNALAKRVLQRIN